MFKRCQVVMFSTEKASHIWRSVFNDSLNYSKELTKAHVPMHLYILSDEEIKEGDWIINLYSDSIFQWVEGYGKKQNNEYTHYILDLSTFKKIVATTDKSLELPEPSEGFIKAYIEAYNNNNPITEVDVEYEEINVSVGYPMPYFEIQQKLKVNPKDNTITIKKIKNSWNMKEIYELMNKAVQWGRNTNNYQATRQEIDNWIKQNL